jgi:hypothetical protein
MNNRVIDYYNRISEKKKLALKEFANDKYKLAFIWLLLFATTGWILSACICTYELIRGDYYQFTRVHDCAICNDGWISHSWGPGTCSWHGGVSYYKYKDVLSGIHFANPHISVIIILICFTFLIVPSCFSKVYRVTAFSFQLTAVYFLYILVRSFYRVATFPIYIVYHLLKSLLLKEDV